jgi:hypothetical protein
MGYAYQNEQKRVWAHKKEPRALTYSLEHMHVAEFFENFNSFFVHARGAGYIR